MTITLERDDWIPLLENAGVAVMLTDVARYLPTIDDLRTDLNRFCIDNGIEMQGFSPAQIQPLVADLVLAGKLVGSEIAEGSNVEGIERAAAPTASIQGGTQVWVSLSGLERPFDVRFYVNGVLKATTEIPAENTNASTSTALSVLGAEPGDVVQVCRVVPVIVDEEEVGHVVGWMTSAAVP